MTKTQNTLVGILMVAAAGTANAQQMAKPAAPPAAPAPAAAPMMAKPAGPVAAGMAKPSAAVAANMPAAAPTPAAKPAAAAAAPKPMPSKELEAFMKPFDGSWKCETKFAPNAFGPGSPEVTAKSSVKFKKDLDGFFYRGEYEIKKQKGVEMPMKAIFFTGFDSGSMEMVVTGVDSLGGIGMGAGKIMGNTVTYTGDQYMMGMKVKTRETMTATGPKEASHKLEMDMGKGFAPFNEDTCKK